MKRDIAKLKQQQFDILVVGAGIHGACIARDAAMRGLTVALIDKGDICGQTSHNSLKIIHGGIRYLQHLNIKRTLESIQEQKIWLTIAPHLVKPIKCIMPTYGHGMRGPEAMWCGIKAYELLGLNRNRHIPVHRKIPHGKIISKRECLQLIPGANTTNLTGAAIWYDAQVFAADEAVIEIAASAAQHDAEVANYVSASSLLLEEGKVTGVRAKDEINQETFDINAKLVINATGPWAKELISTLKNKKISSLNLPLTKSMNIVTRALFDDYAVAIQSKRKSDSVVGSTKRLYFFTPWNDLTIIGTTHFPDKGKADSPLQIKEEIVQFINEINEVYPPANLTLDDVRYCYRGLTPSDEPPVDRSSKNETNRSHHSKIIDHATDGIDNILSIIGVKYTTARLVAEKCVHIACSKLGKPRLTCKTRTQPLEDYDKASIDIEMLNDKEFKEFCQHHLEHTMTMHLSDLVLRRMNLAARGRLTQAKLQICVGILSQAYAWNEEQKTREIEALNNIWLNPPLKVQI